MICEKTCCINGSMVTSRPSYNQPSDISSLVRRLEKFSMGTPRCIENFLLRRGPGATTICRHSKSIFYIKNHLNLSDFFFIENINLADQSLLLTCLEFRKNHSFLIPDD